MRLSDQNWEFLTWDFSKWKTSLLPLSSTESSALHFKLKIVLLLSTRKNQ